MRATESKNVLNVLNVTCLELLVNSIGLIDTYYRGIQMFKNLCFLGSPSTVLSALSPNTFTLEVSAATYELQGEEGTIQSIRLLI